MTNDPRHRSFRQPAPATSSPIAAGSSQRLPPVRHTSHAAPDAAASAVEMPTHRQPRSAAPGPSSHASRSYSARPPSSGRMGSRLKAHSTPLAPAAVVHPIPPRTAAASRFANGPARADASSCP